MAQQLRNQKQRQEAFRRQQSAPDRILSSSRPLVAPPARIIKQVSEEASVSPARHSTYHYEYIDNRVTTAMTQAAQDQALADQKFQDQVAQFKKLIGDVPYNKLLYFIGLVVGAGFVGATNEFSPEYLVVIVSLVSFIMFFALKV